MRLNKETQPFLQGTYPEGLYRMITLLNQKIKVSLFNSTSTAVGYLIPSA